MRNFLLGMLGLFLVAPLVAQQQDTSRLPSKVVNALLNSDTLTNKLSIDTLPTKAKKNSPA